jgi:spore coat-associated protein N
VYRKVFALLIVAGLLAALAGAGSALFTSTAAVDSNAFTTGTVIISTNPTTALITFSSMAAGDQVTHSLTVSNGGTLDLRYAVTSTATNADSKGLMNQLVLTIKGPGTGTCDNAGFASYTGTQLYTGVLGSVAGTNVIGDPTQGQQTGDRTLSASTNEVLCFHVSLPSASGNAYQNATTTATFTFAAEQTANNP